MNMKVENNIHQGHRKRMFDKALKYSNALSDHELLEVVLFYAIPRIDTNGIAHALLRTFGSLSKVFSAPAQSLMAVDGVGEKTAVLIQTIGKLIERQSATPKRKTSINNHEQLKNIVLDAFKGYDTEMCVVFLMDSSFKVIGTLDYSNTEKFSVRINVNEVLTAFNAIRPKHVIFSHNHISESCQPSKEDDIATKQFNVLCSLHGVNLLDHVIVQGKEVFIYRMNGLMEMIKDQADRQKVLNNGGLNNE